MARQITARTTHTKDKMIALGLYRPARWLIDNVVDRNRAADHAARVSRFRSLLRQHSLCFDVGANIGDYAHSLACAGAKVIAIEPQPSCARELRARFRRNNKVTIIQAALGANRGIARLFLRESSGSSSLIEAWENRPNIGSVDVEVETLDSIISSYGTPDYIKIDIEGFELEAIRGLHSKIPLLSIEYHLTNEDIAQKLQLIDLLTVFGPLRFNILVEGSAEFFWSDFVSEHTFINTFPNQLAQINGAFLGDIFIKAAE